MKTPSSFWQYVKEHRPVRLILEAAGVLLTLITLFLGNGFGMPPKAFAQSPCPSGEKTYVVNAGDNLSTIAERYHTDWQTLVSSNHLANANFLSVDETICIPKNVMGSQSATQAGASGTNNPYPYGQCTWWADERYHQLHGVYVPWTNESSDAWQWTERARTFGWHVSSHPSVGAILNLQPWVQGAYGLGHVAVVEQILSNGNVVASNMNWGSAPGQVIDVTFTPDAGVTFLTT